MRFDTSHGHFRVA